MRRDRDQLTLYVDPGKHFSAVARFLGRRLIFAELRPSENPLFNHFRGVQVICERPRVRSEQEQARDKRRIRSSDIEDLLFAAGQMTSGQRVELVSTAAWKGSARKEPMHARLDHILAAEEKRILAEALDDIRPTLHHNVLDAVCMGLKDTGRWT